MRMNLGSFILGLAPSSKENLPGPGLEKEIIGNANDY